MSAAVFDLTCCPSGLCLKASFEFHSSFSRHAKAQTSLALVIWLNENFCTVRKSITVFSKTQPPQRKKHKKTVLFTAVVPSSWEEGCGVVERNTVLTYFIYLVKHCLLSLPPRPTDTPPPRKRGPRCSTIFSGFCQTKR